MSANYTETVVPCGVCGANLSEAEIRYLWTDTDFLQHPGHYVLIRPEDGPTYWAVASDLSGRGE